jgi:transcriptional regulator with XRE-family HTH domain
MPRPKRSKKAIAFAKEVREQLRALYLSGADRLSQRQLAKRAGSTFQTVNGWFQPTPALPGVLPLVALARRDNVSLNHLLLSDGPPFRGQMVMPKDLETALRAHVLAELRRGASADEARSALAFGGSPLRVVMDHYRTGLTKARAIRSELLEDIAAAAKGRRAHHHRNQEAIERWTADAADRRPARFRPPSPEERPELWADMDEERARLNARALKTVARSPKKRSRPTHRSLTRA